MSVPASGIDPGALPDHVRRNRIAWNVMAAECVAGGERAWAQEQVSWGVCNVPESELWVLPDLNAMDGRTSGCTGSNGLTTIRSNSTLATAIGSVFSGQTRFTYATLDWARRWPTEEIWKARKRGSMP